MFFNILTGAAVAFIRFIILIFFYFILIMRPDIQALPKDPATASFCSVILLDSRFNNPIGKVANEIFRKILQDVRQKRFITKRSSRDLRSIVLNPMSITNSQKSIDGEITKTSSSSSTLLSKSKRIVNRWWLFAMLAAHPVLSRYRHREEIVDDDDDERDETMTAESSGDEAKITTKTKKKTGDVEDDDNNTLKIITDLKISVPTQDTHTVAPSIGIIANTETSQESIITEQKAECSTDNMSQHDNYTAEKSPEGNMRFSQQSEQTVENRKSRIQLASSRPVNN
jgi:hypothetical protein